MARGIPYCEIGRSGFSGNRLVFRIFINGPLGFHIFVAYQHTHNEVLKFSCFVNVLFFNMEQILENLFVSNVSFLLYGAIWLNGWYQKPAMFSIMIMMNTLM